MNAFNRLVTILFLLCTVVATAIVLAVPERVLTLSIAWLQSLEKSVPQFSANPQQWWSFLLFRALIAVLVVIICLALLWMETRRPRSKMVKVHKADGAEVVVKADAISRSLQYHLDRLPEVIKVRPVISGRGQGVEVQLNLETTPEVDIPAKAEEVRQVVLQVVEGQMGLKLASNPKIKIDYSPYSDEAKKKRHELAAAPRSERGLDDDEER